MKPELQEVYTEAEFSDTCRKYYQQAIADLLTKPASLEHRAVIISEILSFDKTGSHAIPWTNSEVPLCLQERPCPRCGGVMHYNGKWLACECGHDRDVEIFFPFRDMADSARPIMPAVTHGGW